MEVKAALADAVVKMEQQKKETARLKLANEALSAGKKGNVPEVRDEQALDLWCVCLLGC